jgi:hypothetical protein
MSGSGAKKRHGDYFQSLSLCPRRFPSVAWGTASRRVHGCATWADFTKPGFCFIKTVGRNPEPLPSGRQCHHFGCRVRHDHCSFILNEAVRFAVSVINRA